jgi:hypothetical protein
VAERGVAHHGGTTLRVVSAGATRTATKDREEHLLAQEQSMSEIQPAAEPYRDEPKKDVYAGGALVLVGLVLLVWQLPWALEVFRGPRPIAETELAQLGENDTPTSDYIVYTAPAMIDTGLGVTKNGKLTLRYILVRVGNRWAIATVGAEHRGNTLTGYIKRLDSFWGRSTATDQLRTRYAGYQLTHYSIRGSKDETGEAWALIGVVAFFVLSGGYFMMSGFLRWRASSVAVPKRTDGTEGTTPNATT